MYIYRERPAELSPQVYYENARYKLSKYTLLYEYEDYKIAFTTLGNCCVIYKKEEERYLKKFFVENWFLTRESLSDFEVSQTLKTKFFERNTRELLPIITHYTIITTTDCNARCYYCYEKNIKAEYLSESTAVDVANFIVKNYKQTPISIEWFGGEPLYNENVIDIISNILCENNIEFSSSMISNGILFDENKIDKYKNIWKLKRCQITLDGINDYYNKVKNYIYTDIDAFNIVLNNIDTLSQNGITVIVRLNLGLKNINELKSVIELIDENNINCEYYVINIFELEITDTDKIFELRENIDAFIDQRKPLNFQQVKNGLNTCMVDGNKSILVNTNGKFNLCHHDIDDTEYIGDIYSSQESWDINLASEKKKNYNCEYCNNCIFHPSCFTFVICALAGTCSIRKLQYREKRLAKELSYILKDYVLNIKESKQ